MMTGKQVTRVADPLVTLEPAQLYRMITDIRSESALLVNRLRALRQIDPLQYKRLKTQLPYFVCGHFRPAYRRKENFTGTSYFVLDLDHLSASGKSAEKIREDLQHDPRIMMLFSSPGNDGLKLLFRFAKPVNDSAYYQYFYKRFSAAFAKKYGLDGVVDLSTSDVSRCCFLSYDPAAVFSPVCEEVKTEDWLSPEDLHDADLALKEEQESLARAAEEGMVLNRDEKSTGTDDEIIRKIRERLLPRPGKPHTKEICQPPELDAVWDGLQVGLLETGLVVEKVLPIAYGRQLRLRGGNRWAELNIFYGKRGFSVVLTTRTGSNRELAELAAQWVRQYLDETTTNKI